MMDIFFRKSLFDRRFLHAGVGYGDWFFARLGRFTCYFYLVIPALFSLCRFLLLSHVPANKRILVPNGLWAIFVLVDGATTSTIVGITSERAFIAGEN
jgi:hypothetical protein